MREPTRAASRDAAGESVSDDLAVLVRLVANHFDQTGDAPDYLRRALKDALEASLPSGGVHLAPEPDIAPFTPSTDQIWRPKTRDENGRKISALMGFQRGFGGIPYAQRPYAHQVRQNKRTRPLYDALCVYASRNKSLGRRPSSIEDFFPVLPEARGGTYASVKRALAPRRDRRG